MKKLIGATTILIAVVALATLPTDSQSIKTVKAATETAPEPVVTTVAPVQSEVAVEGVTSEPSPEITHRAKTQEQKIADNPAVSYEDASGYCITSGAAEAPENQVACGTTPEPKPFHYRGADGWCSITGQWEAQQNGYIEDESCK